MKYFFISFATAILLFSSITIKSQPNVQSPTITGARAKVTYINNRKAELNIPQSLTPYLAGLLMSNNINSKTQIDQALLAWTKKYNELKSKIDLTNDTNIKKEALSELQQGNFTGVENLLNSNTNYFQLLSIFPNSYKNARNQSPTIIGDYANVTYVVNEIIQYNLPDGVTVALLSQLKIKDDSLKKQSDKIESKSALVKRWITQYRELEKQLKDSPDSIRKNAYAFFEKGDFDNALKVLNKASGDEVLMAENRILKAKLLLLKLNYDSLDVQLRTIRKYYSTAIPFLTDFQSHYDYAKFLIDYVGDNVNAIPELMLCLDSAKSLQQKVEVRKYLSMAYSTVNLNKSIEYAEEALKFIDAAEPIYNMDMIREKATLLYDLGITYRGDTSLTRKSIKFFNDAILTLKRDTTKNESQQFSIAIYEAAKGKSFQMLNDTLNAMQCYLKAKSLFEKESSINRSEVLLWQTYFTIGQLLQLKQKNDQALVYYQKAKNLIEPKININSSNYFLNFFQVYDAIITIFELTAHNDSILIYLYDINNKIKPFMQKDSISFRFYQALIYTSLGNYYLKSVNNLFANYNLKSINISSAKSYLTQSYLIYFQNLSLVTDNLTKRNFQNCIILLNQAYILSNDFNGALDFNNTLIDRLMKLSIINPLGLFDDFISQVYGLISDDYAMMRPNSDSSIYYLSKSLAIVEPKALQYPLLYNEQYFSFCLKICAIYVDKQMINNADQRTSLYISSWENIYKVSEPSRNVLTVVNAERIALFASLFQQKSTTAISSGNRDTLLLLAQKYYQIADNNFNLQQNKSIIELNKYAFFLVARSIFENYLSQTNIDNESVMHKNNKCQYAQNAKTILTSLPQSPLIPQTQLLLSDCSNLGK